MEKNSSSFEYANRLPNSLFQGNREKFFKAFKQQVPDHGKALLLFKGKEEIPIDSTDIEYTVKQESFFYYLFGVHETGCSAAIDISEEKVYLFFPNFSEIYKIWFKVLSTEEIRSLYPDFEIFYMNDLEQWVKDFAPSQIFINKGVNSDSGLDTLVLSFKWMDDYTIEQTKMHNILSDCRSIKTPDEIKIMEIAVAISSEAHVHTMKHCKPGVRESYLESKFRAYCHERYNCKFSHYQSICA